MKMLLCWIVIQIMTIVVTATDSLVYQLFYCNLIITYAPHLLSLCSINLQPVSFTGFSGVN